MVFFNRLYLIF